MSYLVDTNVVSELRRKLPNSLVVEWISKRPPTSLYLSVLTMGELRKGVECVAISERRLQLLDWLEVELPAYFSGRVLPVTTAIADRWGTLLAAAGRPLPAIDSLLVATALHHGLTLVTRNVRDTAGFGVPVIDPWQG